jgi:dienelactone hydrolase
MRRLRRYLILIVLAASILLLALAYVVVLPATRIERQPENPKFGWRSPFYLYVSPSARKKVASGQSVTILVQPNNSGVNSDDPKVHEDDAWWITYGRSQLANELGVVLLVPAFPRPAKDWKVYTHALDRDTFTAAQENLARPDLQLIAMIDATRDHLRKQGIKTQDRVLIQGFSASGMFANRFAVLHPDRVLAVAAGAPGGWPIVPVAVDGDLKLPYPAGIADLDSLTGKPFDLETYRKVPQLIYAGDQDDNDSLDFQDGWEKEAAEPIQKQFGDTPLARWKHAERLFTQSGANAQFVLVKGVGHNRRQLQYLATEFFKNELAKHEVTPQ